MAGMVMRKMFLRVLLILVAIHSTFGLATSNVCNAQLRFHSPMYDDPEIEYGTTSGYFLPGLKELWLRALRRPSPEMQVKAADAFAEAHRLGLQGLEDVLPDILRVFSDDETDPTTRLACARTIVEFEFEKAAPEFFARINDSPLDLSRVIEPALARWEYEAAIEVWTERLSSDSVFSERRILAIRALTECEYQDCIAQLEALTADRQLSSKLRLSAAEALSILAPDAQSARASDLFRKPKEVPIDAMIAARLLQSTNDEADLELLSEMLSSSNQAINVLAAKAKWRIDPASLIPSAASLQSHRSPSLRLLAVDVLALSPTEASVDDLVAMLDDAHPEVRSKAREQLESFLSQDRFSNEIWASVEDILATRNKRDDWRVLEQAILMVGNMDHKPLAILIPPHLGTLRREVCTTAAWAIRTLAVPETFAPSLEYCQSVYERRAVDLLDWPRQEELIHLFQLFGLEKYEPAEPLLKQFIPKDISLGSDSRAAAVWALGYIHEDVPDYELARQLLVRVNDRNSPNPELAIVRRMCINAFGRMMCEELLDDLRFSQTHDTYPTQYTASWAINRLTGEPIPDPPESSHKIGVWFLEPILSLSR